MIAARVGGASDQRPGVDGDGGGRARELALIGLSRWRIEAGYILAGVALVFAHPTRTAILASTPAIAVGLGLRTWARGHLERRRYLTRSGPYAWVRHPLYVGSFLLGVGFTAMIGIAVAPLLFATTFAVAYGPKAMREEAFLRARYGDDYASYAAQVGAVLPRLSLSRATPGALPSIATVSWRPVAIEPFRWRRVLRHREWLTWMGAAAAFTLLWMQAG